MKEKTHVLQFRDKRKAFLNAVFLLNLGYWHFS